MNTLPQPVVRYLASRAINGPWHIIGNKRNDFSMAVVIPALAESARLTVLENEIHPNSRLWQDCRLIAQKPNGVSP